MKDNLQFQQLRQKIYLRYHQDGILDLAVGLCAFGFSLSMINGSAAFLIFAWLPMLLYLPLKNGLTIPRFGYIQFSPKRIENRRLIVAFGVGVLMLVFFLGFGIIENRINSPEWRIWMQQYHMVVLGAFPALAAFAFAAITGIHRFYAYALMMVLFPAIGALLQVETFIPIMILGLTIAIVGGWLLGAFLKQYPLEEKGNGNAEG